MPAACIVVPCFNESERFSPEKFSAYLEGRADRFFVFVNDGSRDRTAEILETLEKSYPENIRVLSFSQNRGKAEAVRAGVRMADQWRKFECIGYLDADLSVPLREVDRFVDVLGSNTNVVFILGSRSCPGTGLIKRNWLLKVAGNTFALISSLLLGIRIHDTQCGFKILRTEMIDHVFGEPFISRWIFDVEILRRVLERYGRSAGRQKIREYPLEEWLQRGESKISFWRKMASFFVLFRVFAGPPSRK